MSAEASPRSCLREALAAGRAALFTGAGFSCDARGRTGERVPLGAELADALYEMCFAPAPRDSSRLQDLFEHARATFPERLNQLLLDRLVVAPESVPAFLEPYFVAPWSRAYTLNVDDLELAAARKFGLAGRVVAVSALAPPHGPGDLPLRDRPRGCGTASDGASPKNLEFVHLNGFVHDGPARVTFSTTQYGARLARRDPYYLAWSEDLATMTFVFVGTTLDEAPLWQHLEIRAAGGDRVEPARPSFIVTPELDRARQTLLKRMNITWIPLTTEHFAREVLAPALSELATRPTAG